MITEIIKQWLRYLQENALKEINEEYVTVKVDIKDIITFDNNLETHQTFESTFFFRKRRKQ
jgi:hypothetical protein